MNAIRGLSRNPLSLYLRFLTNSIGNRLQYRKFHQGYMSRVVACEIEPHVQIFPEAAISGCLIGSFSYISSGSKIVGTSIGRFCSIGPGCRIGLGCHPTREFVSTSPVFFSTVGQCGSTFVTSDCFAESARISVGNDVWMGANVMVVDGIRIGDGAIIAAGAVVVSNVPDYAIFGGVPARLLRFRFNPAEISFLLAFEWWNREESWLRKNHHRFRDIKQFMLEFASSDEAADQSAPRMNKRPAARNNG